jgi:hypothetical protein
MNLAATYSLIDSARRGGSPEGFDVDGIRKKFAAAYAEIEAPSVNHFSLSDVVNVVFSHPIAKAVGAESEIVKLFYRASRIVAARVDNGEDGTRHHRYHNPPHFGKADVNFAGLVAFHNYLVETRRLRSQPVLRNHEIAKGLFVKTSHDVGHNGIGNTVNGIHVPLRNEQTAIDTTRNWLTADIRQLSESTVNPIYAIDALNLIYPTDTSGDPSPARSLREWHDYYFNFNGPPRPADRFPELASITPNPIDILIAAFAIDADIFASVMNDVQFAKETRWYAEEMGRTPTRESDLFFLENILGGRMTTDAARLIGDPFIARKIAELKMA